MTTKRDLIQGAYAEIGLASYVFDLSPEDLAIALRRLDSMMAEWTARGIVLGYPVPVPPALSLLEDPTAVPDSAIEAILTNLGIRLAPGLGKTLSADTRIAAKNGYNLLLIAAAQPSEMQLGMLPAGAGRKAFDGAFFTDVPAPIIP